MILGDVMNDDNFINHVVDILQGDTIIENTIHLSQYAKNKIEFFRHLHFTVNEIAEDEYEIIKNIKY
jgi:hypothetical protein